MREEEIENNAYRAYAYDTKPPVSQFQGVLEEKDKFMEKREKFLAYDHLNNLTKVPRWIKIYGQVTRKGQSFLF